MSKNKGLGLVSALAVGAGVAAVAAGKKYKTAETKKKEDYDALHNTSEYRNTERGKYEKNSKGIYYTNGNYEAFARPRKPEGVDDKHAYIVGSGLASLAAACFLVRDGQMPGKNIHILEAMDIAGGACDGIFDPSRGYVMRGGREMENHFECLWDLFRSIPSIETPGVSVLDEYYWLNKEDPNYSLCRATKERGKDAHTDGKFNLSQKGCMEIMKLFFTKDEDLYDKKIEDVFDDEVFIIWNHNNELDNLSSRYLFCLEDGSQTGGYGKDSNKEFIIYSVFDRVLNAGAFSLNNEMNYIYPTRKFIDMFVCTNGMPTTNNEQFKGYQNVTDEYQNRDYRLMAYVGGPAESIGSTSGYGDQKFRNPIVGDKKESANYPVLRLAEVCLNYAEAIMERYGEITDAQLGISINKLRDRAGVAHLTNALVEKIKKQLNSEKELSEIMLDEIRRERTVELYMEGFRYDDLKRWGILEETLNQSRLGRVVGEAGYSTPFKDASGNPTSKYDAKSYVYGEETVITGDGKEHACVVISPKANSTVRKAHYLWPIPQHQINLNPNLKQNPGYRFCRCHADVRHVSG